MKCIGYYKRCNIIDLVGPSMLMRGAVGRLYGQNALGARHVVAACLSDGHSYCQGEGFEGRLGTGASVGVIERQIRTTDRVGRREPETEGRGLTKTYMWWLFSPRIQSTWSVTPAAKANDCKRWGIISVDTEVELKARARARSVQRRRERLVILTVSKLFPCERQVAHKIRSGGNIDHCAGQRLRHERGRVYTPHTRTSSKGA
jgi:hypothetical protein